MWNHPTTEIGQKQKRFKIIVKSQTNKQTNKQTNIFDVVALLMNVGY